MNKHELRRIRFRTMIAVGLLVLATLACKTNGTYVKVLNNAVGLTDKQTTCTVSPGDYLITDAITEEDLKNDTVPINGCHIKYTDPSLSWATPTKTSTPTRLPVFITFTPTP